MWLKFFAKIMNYTTCYSWSNFGQANCRLFCGFFGNTFVLLIFESNNYLQFKSIKNNNDSRRLKVIVAGFSLRYSH